MRWCWQAFLGLVVALISHILVQLLLLYLYDPKGYSLKNRFIDSGYGFFTYEVGDDLCNSSAGKELTQPPSLVLQRADALLQRHSQLRDVLRGSQEKAASLLLTAHWVTRFAQRSPQERGALQQRLYQLENQRQDALLTELRDGGEVDLSPELLAGAYIYSQCAQKKTLIPPRRGKPEDDADPVSTFEMSTQQFLHGRFLGDSQRICQGFRSEAPSQLNEGPQTGRGQEADVCAPPLEVALQLVPLRLHEWWAKVRWQYHMAEYARKLLTIWLPLNPYMHLLYRQDMHAMLALMGPYLELEPPIPIDPNCRPPKSYWVVPLSRDVWEQRLLLKNLSSTQPPSRDDERASSELESPQPRPSNASHSTTSSSARESGVFSVPESHDNYVLVDEYCEQARQIHHGFFTGKPREKPVKIIDAVILGYDLDLLEVRWHELYHSVDYFVVAEAPHHTLGIFQKPFFFARNKERFSVFADKTIHLVQPPADSLRVARICSSRLRGDEDACWDYEEFQRNSLLHMLAQINAGVNDHGNPHVPPGFLDDDDLVLFSDVDEVVMGDRVRHLKFCEPLAQRQFSWVLVHHPGRLDAMALKNFKRKSGIKETSFPHGIGPLVDTLLYKSLRPLERKKEFFYERAVYLRHHSSELQPHRYLYGGWHLSGKQGDGRLNSTYLPYLFAKVPSDDVKPGYEPWGLYAPLLAQRGILPSPIGGLVQAQLAAWKEFRDYRQVGSLCVEAKDVPPQYKEIGFGSMPWVMRCNPMRYPTWFQQPDPRYSMRPRSSFIVYGEDVDARSLEDWFDIYRFVRDTFSAKLEVP
ncbi:hypothetical protein Esti_004401 [Eimeria stiedai]